MRRKEEKTQADINGFVMDIVKVHMKNEKKQKN